EPPAAGPLRLIRSRTGGRSGLRLWDVVPALIGGIYPHPPHRARRGGTEPFIRRDPPGLPRGRPGVAAPPLGGAPPRASPRGGPRRGRSRRGSLLHVLRAQHDAHPAVQVVVVEPPPCVVLAEHDGQPFPVGLTGQPASAVRHG